MQYGVMGRWNTQTTNVSGSSVTEATISSLTSSATYSIQVAAVNSAGIGVYSVQVEYTEGNYRCSIIICSALLSVKNVMCDNCTTSLCRCIS